MNAVYVAAGAITGDERDHGLDMSLAAQEEPERPALLDLLANEQEDIQ
jgi:hypothetical protein